MQPTTLPPANQPAAMFGGGGGGGFYQPQGTFGMVSVM